jgi:Arc/MetJ family transcription regulator
MYSVQDVWLFFNKEVAMSVITIDLDDDALAEALRVSGIRTKKEAVNTALREFTSRHRQIEALERYATLAQDWDYETWERRHAGEKSGSSATSCCAKLGPR